MQCICQTLFQVSQVTRNILAYQMNAHSFMSCSWIYSKRNSVNTNHNVTEQWYKGIERAALSHIMGFSTTKREQPCVLYRCTRCCWAWLHRSGDAVGHQTAHSGAARSHHCPLLHLLLIRNLHHCLHHHRLNLDSRNHHRCPLSRQ